MQKSQNEVFRTQTHTHVDNLVPDQSPDQSAQVSVCVPLQSTVKKNKTRFLFFFRFGTGIRNALSPAPRAAKLLKTQKNPDQITQPITNENDCVIFNQSQHATSIMMSLPLNKTFIAVRNSNHNQSARARIWVNTSPFAGETNTRGGSRPRPTPTTNYT